MEKKAPWERTYTDNMDDEKVEKKKYWLAALASCVIPGLGQWIKGETVKGVSFFFFALFLLIISFFLSLFLWQFQIGLGVFCFYNILEALLHQPVK